MSSDCLRQTVCVFAPNSIHVLEGHCPEAVSIPPGNVAAGDPAAAGEPVDYSKCPYAIR
jgi:hypothetical protein